MLKKYFINVFQNMQESLRNFLADAIKDILSITTKPGSQTTAESSLPISKLTLLYQAYYLHKFKIIFPVRPLRPLPTCKEND